MLVSETSLAIELPGNDDLVMRHNPSRAHITGPDRQPHRFLGHLSPDPRGQEQLIGSHARIAACECARA